MARIQLTDEHSSDPQIRSVFDEIQARAGRVPAAYRAFARHAHILQANWNRTKNILGQGNLPLELKEAIATRVSRVNGCHFCLHIHRGNLEKLGVDGARIDAIEAGHSGDAALDAVLAFVATATRAPEQLTDADFTRLQTLGYSEPDILEMLTVMEMYTGYNKIIVALGLQLDD